MPLGIDRISDYILASEMLHNDETRLTAEQLSMFMRRVDDILDDGHRRARSPREIVKIWSETGEDYHALDGNTMTISAPAGELEPQTTQLAVLAQAEHDRKGMASAMRQAFTDVFPQPDPQDMGTSDDDDGLREIPLEKMQEIIGEFDDGTWDWRDWEGQANPVPDGYADGGIFAVPSEAPDDDWTSVPCDSDASRAVVGAMRLAKEASRRVGTNGDGRGMSVVFKTTDGKLSRFPISDIDLIPGAIVVTEHKETHTPGHIKTTIGTSVIPFPTVTGISFVETIDKYYEVEDEK